MPLALECLAQMQKVCEQMSIYFRIARPPEAQSLPLISRNVGMVPPGSSMTRLHEFHVRVEGSTMSPLHKADIEMTPSDVRYWGVKQTLM